MLLTLSPPGSLLGAQRPRILHLPAADSTATADAAIELAEIAGIVLDDWQRFSVRCALAELADGRLAAFEFALIVARQNGKDEVLLVLMLAALFLLRKRLIVFTAHLYDTSQENFFRLVDVFQGCAELKAKLPRRGGIRMANGEQGITLKTGQRIRYRTRTKGGGRGWSGDLVILNEAMEVAAAAVGALIPAVSARPNPQVVYAASAADHTIHEHCEYLTSVRNRALEGIDPALAYLEWSPAIKPEEADAAVAADRGHWAQGNPALGGRIRASHIARELESMPLRQFLVERLNAGFWPNLDALAGVPISPQVFRSRRDPASAIVGPAAFAVDVSPDQVSAAIGAAGRRVDGRRHVEVIAHAPGTNWVIGALEILLDLHEHVPGVAVDLGSPAGSLATALAKAEIEVAPVSAQEHAQACGSFSRGITDDDVRHLGTPELLDAVKGATKRPLGDAWAWSRKRSSTDISPLVAVTLADLHLGRAPAPAMPRDPLRSIY